MGRPRTPTEVLKGLGAFKKNPKRGRARSGEPKGLGAVGKPPSEWLIRHAKRTRAAALYAQGCSTEQVRVRLGIPWETARLLLPGRENVYARAARLRALWVKIAKQAPFLDAASRTSLESLCRVTDEIQELYKYGTREERLKRLASLVSAQRGIANDLGLPQASRSRVRRQTKDGEEAPGEEGGMPASLEIDL